MSKPSRDDVMRVAGEPVAIVYVREEKTPSEHGRFASWLINPSGIHNCTKLYTESQLLAMYAAGAEDMRERADDAWADAIQSDCESGVKWLSEKSAECLKSAYPALAKLGAVIRALPINTEGEQHD